MKKVMFGWRYCSQVTVIFISQETALRSSGVEIIFSKNEKDQKEVSRANSVQTVLAEKLLAMTENYAQMVDKIKYYNSSIVITRLNILSWDTIIPCIKGTINSVLWDTLQLEAEY